MLIVPILGYALTNRNVEKACLWRALLVHSPLLESMSCWLRDCSADALKRHLICGRRNCQKNSMGLVVPCCKIGSYMVITGAATSRVGWRHASKKSLAGCYWMRWSCQSNTEIRPSSGLKRVIWVFLLTALTAVDNLIQPESEQAKWNTVHVIGHAMSIVTSITDTHMISHGNHGPNAKEKSRDETPLLPFAPWFDL